MKQLLSALLVASLPGFAEAQDSWSVATPEDTFTHESPSAKVRSARSDLWQFRAGEFNIRLHPRFADGADETGDFRRNNTSVSLRLTVNGRAVRVGCDPADPPVGHAQRTTLTDSRVAGRFELEIVSCNDYFTDAPVAYDGLPFTVTGEFDIERRD